MVIDRSDNVGDAALIKNHNLTESMTTKAEGFGKYDTQSPKIKDLIDKSFSDINLKLELDNKFKTFDYSENR